MNFDQDYKGFIEHLAKAKGLKPVRLNRREDIAVRLFTAYLNIRYKKAPILPDDIKMKLLAIRDALVKEDINEAYHVLYTIADPTFSNFAAWKSLEPKSNKPKSLNGEA